MKILDTILDFIYPPICGICGKENANWLCETCQKRLEKWKILKATNHLPEKDYFEKHLAIFSYQEEIRELILSYKFKENSYLYHTFVKILVNEEKICRFIKTYDIIIPVPIHPKRKGERGYNQTELIAKALGEKLKRRVNTRALRKYKNTKPQSTLNQKERIKNSQNVYAILKEEEIYQKKLLILDDIYTTGSTVKECSKVLKNAGASSIGVLTIAKD